MKNEITKEPDPAVVKYGIRFFGRFLYGVGIAFAVKWDDWNPWAMSGAALIILLGACLTEEVPDESSKGS